jgi:cytosine/uracil/thiamine/allantoin permease
MLGVFLLCESFFVSLIFIILFSFFHNFNVLFFVFVFLLNKFVLLHKLKDIIDFHYQDAILIFVVYLFLGIYLINFANLDIFLLPAYLLYNYAFDLIVLRLLKCELKSY